MAYSWEIGSNPTFRALSYDEWAKPLREATEYHRDIEQQYADLDAQASAWEKLANDVEGVDSQSYQTYSKYSNDLRKMADDFAKYGLRYSSHKGMLDMRSRYAREILPISEAWDKRERLHEMYQKNLIEHPELLQLRDPGKESIDEFVRNPNWTYESVNMNQLYQKVQGEAAAYAKQIISDLDNISKIKKATGKSGDEVVEEMVHNGTLTESASKWYLQYFTKKGFSVDEAIASANNGTLSSIIESAVLASNINNMNHGYSYSTDEERDALMKANVGRLTNYLKGATLSSVGDETMQLVENKQELMDWQAAQKEADRNATIKAARISASAKGGGGNKTEKTGTTWTPKTNSTVSSTKHNEKHDFAKAATGIYKYLNDDQKLLVKSMNKSEFKDFVNGVLKEMGVEEGGVPGIDFNDKTTANDIIRIVGTALEDRVKERDKLADSFKRAKDEMIAAGISEEAAENYKLPEEAIDYSAKDLAVNTYRYWKGQYDSKFGLTNDKKSSNKFAKGYKTMIDDYLQNYTYGNDEYAGASEDVINDYVFDASEGNRGRSMVSMASANGMQPLSISARRQTSALYASDTDRNKTVKVKSAEGKDIELTKGQIQDMMENEDKYEVTQSVTMNRNGFAPTFTIQAKGNNTIGGTKGGTQKITVSVPADSFHMQKEINDLRGLGNNQVPIHLNYKSRSGEYEISDIQSGMIDILTDTQSGGRFSKDQQAFINTLIDNGILEKAEGTKKEQYDDYKSQMYNMLYNNITEYTGLISRGQALAGATSTSWDYQNYDEIASARYGQN